MTLSAKPPYSRQRILPPKDELLGVHEAPGDVLHDSAMQVRRRRANHLGETTALVFRGSTAQGTPKEFVDLLIVAALGLQHRSEDIVLAVKQLIDLGAADKLEGLWHRRFIAAFAFAGQETRRTSELYEKGFVRVRIKVTVTARDGA